MELKIKNKTEPIFTISCDENQDYYITRKVDGNIETIQNKDCLKDKELETFINKIMKYFFKKIF